MSDDERRLKKKKKKFMKIKLNRNDFEFVENDSFLIC